MSGNIFQDVLTNSNAVEEKYLGPSYPYHKYINSPSELGMSSNGTLNALGNDLNGLIAYVEVLVTGNGRGSKTGKPLGNKFFLNTGGKCTYNDNDKVKCIGKDCKNENGSKQDRYIYINNVPMGNIPLISSFAGQNFSQFKGLIPGTISDLNAMNPMNIFHSFLEGTEPDCIPVTMETIDISNNSSTERHFLTKVDINNMDPCSFPDRKNPLTQASCKETFTTLNPSLFEDDHDISWMWPSDPWVQLYFISLGLLWVYILYRFIQK